MSSKEKCNKCNKAVKEGMVCCICECALHIKCAGLTDEMSVIMNNNKNFKWFCDSCLKLSDGFRGLMKLMNDRCDALCNDITKLNDCNVTIKNELNALKQLTVVDQEKLGQMAGADSMLGQSLGDLKSEMNTTWANIVKTNMYAVTNEVKTIRNTLHVASEEKDRENNVILFNLKENDKTSKDKDDVMSVVQSLVGDAIKVDDLLKVSRQGMKGVDADSPRPFIIKFNNSSTKSLVMNKLFKIKSLQGDLNKVRICHDLTREQRVELKQLVTEAKTNEASGDGTFLFRVRGQVGRWKIVKFQKKSH